MQKKIVFENKVQKYIEHLQAEAYETCNYESGLRIAGSVDALETLCLISKEQARYIRSLAGVSK